MGSSEAKNSNSAQTADRNRRLRLSEKSLEADEIRRACTLAVAEVYAQANGVQIPA
jgi:hypothetical protein